MEINYEPNGPNPLLNSNQVVLVIYCCTVSSWMKARKMKSLGMPQFIAAGMLDRNGVKYRFMIMERFGTDLQKLFEANRKSFSHKAVLQLAVRVVSVTGLSVLINLLP